jgi:hypothetical protein
MALHLQFRFPTRSRGRWCAFLLGLLIAATAKAAPPGEAAIIERLERLEARQARLEAELRIKDELIDKLESALAGTEPLEPAAPSATNRWLADDAVVFQTASLPVVARREPVRLAAVSAPNGSAGGADDLEHYGEFQPGGRGFKLADTPFGTVNFSAWTYIRYLNQQQLDNDSEDSFGRPRSIDRRNDLQLNKVNLYFKGWVYDPKFSYLLYTWTSNTSQGEAAQVVVAGSLGYRFNEHLSLGGGIGALPGTRSLRGTFPYWLKVDTRPMADEFFRPSYTSGIWASGNVTDTIKYKVMLGNNLSQLGVNANKLNDKFSTISGSIWWMPTTGEFGPAGGYGDFEFHDDLAPQFGLNFTYSPEDRQSQPGLEDINNTQIRLSDGTTLFSLNAFDTDGSVTEAKYYMTSFDAGMKYRGFALEGEYYWRWVRDFDTIGSVPEDSLFDHGFQVQASAMLMPKTLQAYVAGSYINGEYGKPWDLALGVNVFPFQQRLLRWNTELLYLDDSPVGYSSVPFAVGGDGPVFYTNLELYF